MYGFAVNPDVNPEDEVISVLGEPDVDVVLFQNFTSFNVPLVAPLLLSAGLLP